MHFPKDIQNEDILVKEAFAIYSAIQGAPVYANLTIYNDSKANYWCFRKGICHNFKALEIINAAMSRAITKVITLIIRFIKSEHNPADYPSRNFIRSKWDFFEETHISRDEVLTLLDSRSKENKSEIM
jgi:hypothetical protein